MGVRLVYGEVSATEPGYARVYFPAQDIVSDWLPQVKMRAMGDDVNFPLAKKEMVACLMNFTPDDRCDTGVILGAVNNDIDQPATAGSIGKWNWSFNDGGLIEYDTSAQLWKINSGSGESLYKILKETLEAIVALTVNTGTGPSSTPINMATFNTLLTRLDTLMKD